VSSDYFNNSFDGVIEKRLLPISQSGIAKPGKSLGK
jgi:hypothetical protein